MTAPSDCRGCVLLVPEKWSDKSSQNKDWEQYDFGMVILDSAIGKFTGWAGVLCLPDELLTEWPVSVTGYPGDKGIGNYYSTQMWEMSKAIKTVTKEQLFYKIRTYEGQSGSAIWRKEWPGYEGPYTVGIHTYGEKTEGEGNRGTRITVDKFNLILEWLKAYQLPNVKLFLPVSQQSTLPSLELSFSPELLKSEIHHKWIQYAQSDDIHSLYQIGVLYTKGAKGIPQNQVSAYAFFYKVIEKGKLVEKEVIQALTALGTWYESYGEKYILKAISLYYQATKREDAEAMRRLGILYLEGRGVPKNSSIAKSLFEEAKEKGNGEACYHLAQLYKEGKYVTINQEYAAQLRQQARQLGYKLPVDKQKEGCLTKLAAGHSCKIRYGGISFILVGIIAIIMSTIFSFTFYDGLTCSLYQTSYPPIVQSQSQAIYCIQGKCSSSLDEIYNAPNIFHNSTTAVHRERFFEILYRTLEKQEGEITELGTSQISLSTSKQQFAQAYGKLCQGQFNLVWWFNASESLDQQYQKLAQLLNKDSNLQMWNKGLGSSFQIKDINIDTVQKIKSSLETTKYQWLLIFDNVENEKAIERYVPQKHDALSQGYVVKIGKNVQSNFPLSLNTQKFEQLYNMCGSGVYELPDKTYQESMRTWNNINQHCLYDPMLRKRPKEFIEAAAEGENRSYLTLIWQSINKNNEAIITAMGGSGKSYLALQYAYEALEHNAYHLIYWINSETNDSLKESYKRLLQDKKIPYEIYDDIILMVKKEKQKRPDEKWLLIYDNVPDSRFLDGKVPQKGVKTIITSRCQEGWDHPSIKVEKFSKDESINYLFRLTHLEPSVKNKTQAAELAEELGRLPLALSYAGNYIKYSRGGNKDYDFGEYLKKFREGREKYFEEHIAPFDENKINNVTLSHEYLIKNTWKISGNTISTKARQLMVYFSYLEPHQIVKGIFLESDNDISVDASLAQLNAFSLIEASNPYISIHRLLQLAIRNEHEREQTENVIETFYMLLPGLIRQCANIRQKTYDSENIAWAELRNLYIESSTISINLKALISHIERLSLDIRHSAIDWSELKLGGEILQDLCSEEQAHIGNEIFKRLDQVNADERKELIFQISKNTLSKRGINLEENLFIEINEHLPSILSLKLNNNNTLLIAKYIASAPVQERPLFIDNIKNLLRREIKDKDRFIKILFEADSINSFARIENFIFSIALKKGIVPHTSILVELIEKNDTNFLIVEALKQLNKTPLDENNELLSLLIDSLYEFEEASSNLSNTLYLECKDQMQQLLPSDAPIDDQVAAMNSFYKIDIHLWPKFLKESKPLFEAKIFGNHQAKIVKLLAEISPQQWGNIVTCIHSFLSNEYTNNNLTKSSDGKNFDEQNFKKDLILGLLSIEPEKRHIVCEHLARFWKDYQETHFHEHDHWYRRLLEEAIQKNNAIIIIKGLSQKL